MHVIYFETANDAVGAVVTRRISVAIDESSFGRSSVISHQMPHSNSEKINYQHPR
jgi:hypothetical protein